jgi:hypothetical protein
MGSLVKTSPLHGAEPSPARVELAHGGPQMLLVEIGPKNI